MVKGLEAMRGERKKGERGMMDGGKRKRKAERSKGQMEIWKKSSVMNRRQ